MTLDLRWHDNQMRISGWQFDNQAFGGQAPDRSRSAFQLYKPDELLRDLQSVIDAYPSFSPKVLVELGMWDGGSLALLNELFGLDVAVGLDLDQRGDSEYFRKYADSSPTRFVTRWGTDQGDADQVAGALTAANVSTLDLVVDDGAHLYAATKAAFSQLFPRVRPGGLYLIEDYGWAHLKAFQPRGSLWHLERSMADFTYELVQVMASEGNGLIAKMTFLPTLVVIERGSEKVLPGFDVHSHIRVREEATKRDKGEEMLRLAVRRARRFKQQQSVRG